MLEASGGHVSKVTSTLLGLIRTYISTSLTYNSSYLSPMIL